MALKFNRILGSLSLINKKFYSKKAIVLTYSDYGEPIKVISQVEEIIKAPTKNDVVLKMIASPVNPADINMIQGILSFIMCTDNKTLTSNRVPK